MEREESDLYGLPLGEFVPARTELERRLRKDGDRDRAAAAKKLPKPSVAAWAVNQASRSQPKDRRELLTASADLRATQERLLAGDASAADLEKATARQRAAIDALADAASGLLTSDGKGLGDATLARVRETLAAVAADEELAELVDAGTLDRERRPAGLGFGLGDPGGPDAPAAAAAKRRGKGSDKERKPARGGSKAAKRREREVRKAREATKAAKAEEREAGRRHKAAERAARKAANDLERAERAAGDARERAEAARSELEAATAAQAEAGRARESAEAELDRLG